MPVVPSTQQAQGTLQPFPTNGESPVWAGSVAFADAGDAVTSVAGGWTVPDIVAVNADFTWACATWIGIDGWFPDDEDQESVPYAIAQVGTTHMAEWMWMPGDPDDDVSLNDMAFPWFQWYPDDPVSIANLPVSPGDVMHCVIVAWSPAEVYFHLVNLTTGVAAALVKTARKGQRVYGYSAEWIVEWPGGTGPGGQATNFPPYGAVYFDNCVATAGSGRTHYAGSGDLISMVTSAFIEISVPHVITDTVIRVDYTDKSLGGI
jgi:hypothetical protein